jgi:hypothetical protein
MTLTDLAIEVAYMPKDSGLLQEVRNSEIEYANKIATPEFTAEDILKELQRLNEETYIIEGEELD